MNYKFINENIEEVLIRLITLECYLDTLKMKDIFSVQSLLTLFKKEIKDSLKCLENFSFGISTPVKKVLKKQSVNKEKKNAIKKRKVKKSYIRKHKKRDACW